MGKPFDEAQNAEKADEVIEALDRENNPFNIKMQETASGMYDLNKLFCYGCSHSSAEVDFPGKPSGERPCFFCVRNKNREKWQEDFKKIHGFELKEWYDQSPIAFYPMDCYQPIDMIEQQERWNRKSKGEKDWNSSRGGLRFG